MTIGNVHVSKEAIKASIEIMHFVWDELVLRDIGVRHCPIWNKHGTLISEPIQILHVEGTDSVGELQISISTTDLDHYGRHEPEIRLRVMGELKAQIAHHYCRGGGAPS